MKEKQTIEDKHMNLIIMHQKLEKLFIESQARTSKLLKALQKSELEKSEIMHLFFAYVKQVNGYLPVLSVKETETFSLHADENLDKFLRNEKSSIGLKSKLESDQMLVDLIYESNDCDDLDDISDNSKTIISE